MPRSSSVLCRSNFGVSLTVASGDLSPAGGAHRVDVQGAVLVADERDPLAVGRVTRGLEDHRGAAGDFPLLRAVRLHRINPTTEVPVAHERIRSDLLSPTGGRRTPVYPLRTTGRVRGGEAGF